MDGFLPFWLLGPALGALTVGYWLAVRRPLGVSGVVARFTRVKEERAYDAGVAQMQAGSAALEAAMAAATAEMFGLAPEAVLAEPAAPAPESEASAATAGRECAPPPPLSAHLVFLLGLAGGGLLTALWRGQLGRLGAGLDASFAAAVATGPRGLLALVGGGLLVGFGACASGGCSAGHGLTGCGRLMPGSLLATAVFFSAAVACSLLLGGVA
jgi:uncharacterized protein